MATAVVQEQQLLKTLRWYDGFVIALANPGFLLGSLGYSVGDLGGWGAALLWGISAIVAVFINTIYSELATMFPEKSGGIALYAHEAWRKYTTLVGPIATFGYWIGWSVVLSVNGLFIGQIIQGAVVPRRARSASPTSRGYGGTSPSSGLVDVGLPAADRDRPDPRGLAVQRLRRPGSASRSATSPGVLLMVPLFVMMILPFLNGSFDSANLDQQPQRPGSRVGWPAARARLAVADVLVGLGRRRLRDVRPRVQGHRRVTRSSRSAPRRCSRWSSTSCSRSRSSAAARAEDVVGSYDYVRRDEPDRRDDSSLVADFFVVCLVASFIITMNTATADGGRALFGISRDGMTSSSSGRSTSYHVPGNAMTVDMVDQHPASSSSSGTSSASSPRATSATCWRTCSRSPGSCSCAETGPNWPRPIKLRCDLDPDRRDPRRLVPDPDDRRLRLDPDRRRRLRRHEGEGHRRRRPRDRRRSCSSSAASCRTRRRSTGARTRRRCRRRRRPRRARPSPDRAR